MPTHGAHVWRWFVDLSETRQSTGFGPARLSRLEIQAWERDEGVRLMTWERRALMGIDAAFVASIASHEQPQGGPDR